MNQLKDNRIYQGKGKRLADRGEKQPLFEENSKLFDPQYYQPGEDLLDAVDVALRLGQPLLLTGEAGSGKTQLAHSVAWELGLELFVFQTKSTSTYMDLFYRYDHLRHFQDIQLKKEKPAEQYIEYGPLGRAIRVAKQKALRSVVLIDEIDKAPRDLPNDILNEIERMFFEVKETEESYDAARLYRPILILTSNQEKDLPDAFRRRCVFFHIRFPEDRLESIVRNRLPDDALPADSALKNAIEHFLSIRKLGLEKNPSTAELLGWIALLSKMGLNVKDAKSLTAEEKDALLSSYSVLAKSDEDLKRLRTELTKA